MAKPAEHRAPSTREGNVRPTSTAGLVVPFIVPIHPALIRPTFAGGGMGGVPGAGGGAGGGEGGKTDGGKADPDADPNPELGGRLKKLRNQLEKEMGKQIQAAVAPLNTTLATLSETLKTIAGAGGGGGAGGKVEGDGGKALAGETPEMAGMRRKLEDQDKAFNALKKQLEDEKAAKRQDSRDRTLRERVQKSLTDAGVIEDGRRSLSRATNELIRDGLVNFDNPDQWEDAKTIFRDIAEDEDLDLDTGIGSWLKSEIGKSYLPPRGAAGSGDGPGGRNPGRKDGQQPSDAELANALFGGGARH